MTDDISHPFSDEPWSDPEWVSKQIEKLSFDPYPSKELLQTLCKELGLSEKDKVDKLENALTGARMMARMHSFRDPIAASKRIKKLESARKKFQAVIDILDYPMDPDLEPWERKTHKDHPNFDTSFQILRRYADDPKRCLGASLPAVLEGTVQTVLWSTIHDLKALRDGIDDLIKEQEQRKQKTANPKDRNQGDVAFRAVAADLMSIYRELTGREPGFSYDDQKKKYYGPFLRFVSPVLREFGWKLSDAKIKERFDEILD